MLLLKNFLLHSQQFACISIFFILLATSFSTQQRDSKIYILKFYTLCLLKVPLKSESARRSPPDFHISSRWFLNPQSHLLTIFRFFCLIFSFIIFMMLQFHCVLICEEKKAFFLKRALCSDNNELQKFCGAFFVGVTQTKA